MKVIVHWKTVLGRSMSVWAQYVQGLLGILTFVDPSAALAVWRMMPEPVTARVPPAFVSAVGALLFFLAILTIALRLIRQGCIEAKLEEKKQEASDADQSC